VPQLREKPDSGAQERYRETGDSPFPSTCVSMMMMMGPLDTALKGSRSL
jgi:hypothetical protein